VRTILHKILLVSMIGHCSVVKID